MKEVYEKNILERVKKELKIEDEILKLEVESYGEKITIDGINYFEKIERVVVKYNEYDVAYYDVEKKIISHPRKIKDLDSARYTVKVINNFFNEERIRLPKTRNGYSFDEIEEMLCHLSENELYQDYGIIL